MAYGEKLLNVSDLLAAWQNRAAREDVGRKIKTYDERMQSQIQVDMAKEQLKREKMINDLAKPRPQPLVLWGNSIGYEDWAAAKDKDRAIAQLQGHKPPTTNFYGGGGGGGSGGGGGGRGEGGGATESVSDGQVTVQSGPYGYAGPADKGNDVAEASDFFQKNYNFENPPQTMADLLAEEQNNMGGIRSIINQKYGMPSPETIERLMPNERPIQSGIEKAAADKELSLQAAAAGAPKTGLGLEPKDYVTLGNRNTEQGKQKEEESLQNKIYSTPEFLDATDEIKEKIFKELHEMVSNKGGRAVNIYQILKNNIPGYQMPIPRY